MLPPAVVATGWAWLYHNPFGMLNPLLVGLGLLDAPKAWLASPDTALGAVIVANLWPPSSRSFSSPGSGHPNALYEAAGVDGAARGPGSVT
jgi:trehalose/maltose transport system permease protein